MADFTALKTAIQTYIKQNGNEEITGEKLQEILLSMVTTLGDSAINDLITALADEVAARQNADGTLQQNITNEATARGNADTALGGRIDDEATARANGDTALSNRLGSSITAENTAADQIGAEAEAREAADTALQGLIDGITENITNGYVYAGIATPSSTPATGKVFYLALTAGTYTNFGSAEVPQGINILKYNGSAWSLDAFIGIDDTPTPNSPKLVKSGGVAEELALGAVYDVSAKNPTAGPNNDGKWESLSALLSDANLNTLIPTAVRKGGMSIKFVRTSDNKYVQFLCTADEFTTDVKDWEKINIESEVNKIKTDIDGSAYPVFINRDKLIHKEGNWSSFSGYNAYVFDVRSVKGQTIILNDIKRANSYLFAFVTDYKTIPSSEDTELWNSLLVEGVKASTTGDAFEYKCLVPTTANYLILSGTDTNPATLEQLSSINDRIDSLDKKSEKIDTNEFEISKLKGGNLLLSPIEEITEILDNGGVAGYNKGWLFNYGSGYKTSIFDVSHFEENTKIDVTSVRYGSGYIWVFCKDYKTLPVQSEFENNNSLWSNNLVSAQTGRGGTTGQVYNGTIFKPSGAKYLLLVSNSTTQATAIISEDDGVLNIEGGAIPSITFSNTGHYIDLNGSVGSSSNWEQSNIFELKKGQKLIFSARVTSTLGVLLALTDANGSYYKPIITGGNSIKEYSYWAEEDCYVILQYYRIDGTPTVINDSTRLASIEKEISNIKDVDNITPEYIAKETQRVYYELLSKLNKDTLIVAFNTDQHISPNVIIDKEDNPKYTLHGIKSIANIAKKLPLDFVVLGGDAAGYDNAVSNTVEGILSETNMVNEPLTEINTPVISLPGNHDAYQNNGNITSYGMYNVNFKRSKFVKELVHSGVDNCDSYWDDKDNKVRYIFLDTWSTNVRTESYSDFLSNALSTMEAGYKALVFSHNPLTNEFDGIIKKYRSPSDETGTDAFANPSDLHTILNQYADSIIACICGHSHADVYGVSGAGILYIETTSATHSRMIFRDNGLVIPYDGVLNTAKETSYDYFVVDLTAQTIEAIRFGQGSNRKWYYKGANIGLIGYTNYVYGKTSIGNVTLTFTNNADSSDVVTVTSDSNGDYGVYLKLGATYTISSTGYTLDTTEITVNENTELNITVE